MKHTKLVGIVIILLICFIWGNSVLPSSVSNAISNWFAGIFRFISSSENVEIAQNSHRLVRKMAHFTEFLLLGFSIYLFCKMRFFSPSNIRTVVLSSAMFFPLADETIQLFNDRTSSVKDIWIDIAGFTLGVCLSYLLMRFCIYRHKKKKIVG